MNNRITPEVIFNKFSGRLRGKIEELEYLVYMDKQFEKWLQCELVLAFSDICLPVVFNDNYDEITCNNDNEKVCDIKIEYPIYCNDSTKPSQCDVIIAANPFLLHYADKKTWQVPRDAVDECKKKYRSEKFNYIELKQKSWADIKASACVDGIATDIIADLKTYSIQDCPKFKEAYNPSNVISMCLVSFWDSKTPSRIISQDKLTRVVNNVSAKVMKECDRFFQNDASFLWEPITKEICLLMVFFSI